MPFPLTVARCSTRSRSGTVAAGYVPSNVATGHSGAPILTKSITPTSIEVDEDPMEGLPRNRVVTADGVTVFTLYGRSGHHRVPTGRRCG